MKIDVRTTDCVYITINNWVYYIDDSTNEQILKKWKERKVDIEDDEVNELKGLNSVLCDAIDIKTKLEFLKLTEESKDNDNSQTTLGDCINDIIDFLESL